MRKRIFFGNYFYGRAGERKNLEWLVLREFSDGTALLLSKYCIDGIPYNEKYEPVNWENCSMRRWLNSFFLMRLLHTRKEKK